MHTIGISGAREVFFMHAFFEGGCRSFFRSRGLTSGRLRGESRRERERVPIHAWRMIPTFFLFFQGLVL